MKTTFWGLLLSGALIVLAAGRESQGQVGVWVGGPYGGGVGVGPGVGVYPGYGYAPYGYAPYGYSPYSNYYGYRPGHYGRRGWARPYGAGYGPRPYGRRGWDFDDDN